MRRGSEQEGGGERNRCEATRRRAARAAGVERESEEGARKELRAGALTRMLATVTSPTSLTTTLASIPSSRSPGSSTMCAALVVTRRLLTSVAVSFSAAPLLRVGRTAQMSLRASPLKVSGGCREGFSNRRSSSRVP